MDLTSIAVYSEITTMMDNILENTLANKDQGPNWIRMQPNSGTTAGGDTTTVSGTAYSDSLTAGTHELTITVTTNDPRILRSLYPLLLL